jgi:hypothetical protein
VNSYIYTNANPVNLIDPWGLFVWGSYNQQTGALFLYDPATYQTVTAQFFSGKPGKHLPIPNGAYDILERGKPDFYRLEPVDTPYGNDLNDRTGHGEFRLHKPGGSQGCLTAKNWDSWDSIKKLIGSTESSSRNVQSQYLNPIKRWQQATENLRWYGRIYVTGSW